MRDHLFRTVGTDNAKVSGAFVGWNGRDRDEEHGVGPGGGGGALGQAMNLSCIGSLPEGAIRALTEFGIFGEFASVGIEGIAMEGKVLETGYLGGGMISL